MPLPVGPFVLVQRINLPSCHGPGFRLEHSVLWKPLELASFLELIKASTILLFNRGHVYDNFWLFALLPEEIYITPAWYKSDARNSSGCFYPSVRRDQGTLQSHSLYISPLSWDRRKFEEVSLLCFTRSFTVLFCWGYTRNLAQRVLCYDKTNF